MQNINLDMKESVRNRCGARCRSQIVCALPEGEFKSKAFSWRVERCADIVPVSDVTMELIRSKFLGLGVHISGQRNPYLDRAGPVLKHVVIVEFDGEEVSAGSSLLVVSVPDVHPNCADLPESRSLRDLFGSQACLQG